jgi:hypothetical protein
MVRRPAGTKVKSTVSQPLPEIAFYYPGHLWHSPEWIKSLLLFFDGIGLLVPEYKKREPEIFDPVLAGPLRDKGLLHYLIANKAVDKDATKSLVDAISGLISSGTFDALTHKDTAFHEISMSRMGYYGDDKLASQLFAALKARGLAKDSQDGVSIPLHPLVRYLILTLLAQILRPGGIAAGLDLSPATDQFGVARALTEFLSLPQLPSAGHVVAFDLQSVTVDLSAVPLDEVLSFRNENKQQYRKYIRSIRQFSRELALMSEGDRRRAFNDRQAELDDLASDLRKGARSAWRKPASFLLGIAGGFWTYKTGDPFGALLGVGAVLTGGIDRPPQEAGAFNYLFAAHQQFA